MSSLHEFLWEHSISTQALSLNPDAALQAAIFEDDLVPVGTEIWVDYGSETYAYMAAESLSVPGFRRLYYAEVPHWDEIQVINNETKPGEFDIANYFRPDEGQFGSIFMLSNNWNQGSERVQLQGDGDFAYIVKNHQYEKRLIGPEFIDMIVDTSPGEGKYYTVEGGHWLPRYWIVGQNFNRVETVAFYHKHNCQKDAEFTWSSIMRFNEHYPVWESPSGLLIDDVIEISWILNDSEIERYFYAAGLGLVQWLANDGRRSFISSFVTGGNNQREDIGCL